MEETSQHPGALAKAVAAAQTIRVYDGGLYKDQPLEPVPVLTIEDEPDVTELRSLIAVREVTDGCCMCLGDSVLEFLAGGHRLAIVGVHHMTLVRWSTWDGDARLADGRALAAWLAAHGYSDPHERAEAEDARQARAAADDDAWRSAAPASLRELVSELLATSQTGVVRDELVAEVETRLSAGTPGAVARCRQLLAWNGSGTGKCSGYPVHEEIPGRILTGIPISTLLGALTDEPVDGPVWIGALRHLASWRSRTDEELGQVPPAVWDAPVALADARGDSDTLNRVTAKRASIKAR